MLHEGKIWVGTGENGPAYLLPALANRHGLIAGATGTGKTVSLKVLAEGFSDLGVPVFLSDIKSDLSGMVRSGLPSEAIGKRLAKCGVPDGSFHYHAYPARFWDVYGEQGQPVLATVRDMGPLLLSRMLQLNETQSGVLNILFRYCNDRGVPLDTLQDLRRVLIHMGEHAREFTLTYGNVSAASVGAIQRAVAMLEDQGGNSFFRAPSMNMRDWFRVEEQTGRGLINILSADRLFNNPIMYSTFLLWMLTKLYDFLPERGDAEKPLIVFFFDEAHLLFDDCSRTLMDKIEQVVRLIRSKGVGVYFITQSPSDIPMAILGQLGNRIQHALRAYTPLDQKAVRVAAQTFRVNPAFETGEAITELKTGEALVSFLDEHGAPSVVERVTILPPQSLMGPITAEERATVLRQGYIEDPEEEAAAVQAVPETEPKQDVPEIPTGDFSAEDAAAEEIPADELPEDVPAEALPETETPAETFEKEPVPVLDVPDPEAPAEAPAAPVPVLHVPVQEPPMMAPIIPDEGSISHELQELEEMCSDLSDSLGDVPVTEWVQTPPAEPVVSSTTPEQAPVSAAEMHMSQTFKVFDPTTGKYVSQELPQMTEPAPAAPVQPAPQPVVPQPAAQPQAYVPQPVAQPQAYVPQPAAQPQTYVPQPAVQPQAYVPQPVAQPQAYVPQPAVQPQDAVPDMPQVPVIQVQPAVQQMPVMMLDPTTGQYVQQMMTMQQDPATGNWVPIQQPAIPTDPITLAQQQKMAEQARKDAEKAAKEAAKAAKEQEAAERRARNDALREEAAERARRNDSVAGRIKNAAISSATRQVTNSVTKGVINTISDLFGGKKK